MVFYLQSSWVLLDGLLHNKDLEGDVGREKEQYGVLHGPRRGGRMGNLGPSKYGV